MARVYTWMQQRRGQSLASKTRLFALVLIFTLYSKAIENYIQKQLICLFTIHLLWHSGTFGFKPYSMNRSSAELLVKAARTNQFSVAKSFRPYAGYDCKPEVLLLPPSLSFTSGRFATFFFQGPVCRLGLFFGPDESVSDSAQRGEGSFASGLGLGCGKAGPRFQPLQQLRQIGVFALPIEFRKAE